MTLTAARLDHLRVIYLTGGLFSIVGSLFILLTFIKLKELRQRQLMHLVFFMGLCDLLFTLKFFVPAASNSLQLDSYRNSPSSTNSDHDRSPLPQSSIDTFCLVQAVTQQFFGLASISWYFCISINAFVVLFSHNQSNPLVHSGKLTAFYHFFVWSFSLATTIICYLADAYGNSDDGTCWIKSDHENYRLFFIAPLSLYMIVALLLLLRVLWRRNVLTFSGPNAAFARMLALVAVFLFTWSPTLLMRYFEFFSRPEQIPYFLIILHAISVSIQGFANMCIWISTPVFDRLFFFLYRKSKFLTCLICFFHPLMWTSGQGKSFNQLQSGDDSRGSLSASDSTRRPDAQSPANGDERWSNESPTLGMGNDLDLNPTLESDENSHSLSGGLMDPLLESPSRKDGIPFSLNHSQIPSIVIRSSGVDRSATGNENENNHNSNANSTTTNSHSNSINYSNSIQPYASPELSGYLHNPVLNSNQSAAAFQSAANSRGSLSHSHGSISQANSIGQNPQKQGISLQNTGYFLQYPTPGNQSASGGASPRTLNPTLENDPDETPAGFLPLPASIVTATSKTGSGSGAFSFSQIPSQRVSIIRPKARSIHANSRNLIGGHAQSPDRLTLSNALLESESSNLLDSQLPIPPTNYFQTPPDRRM